MANPYSFLDFRKLPAFGPAPIQSGISAIELPIGPTYHNVVLEYLVNGVKCTQAQAKADIKRVRLKVNGIARFELSGKRLVEMNAFYGQAWKDGEIWINLSRDWYRDFVAVENTAWGTRNVRSLTLEVEFGTPIVNPTMTASALISRAERDLGMIVEVHEFIQTVSGAGQSEYVSLPRGNGDLVALHLDSAVVTSLDVDINSVNVLNGSVEAYKSLLQFKSERVPQADYAYFEGQIRNLLSEGIPLINVSDFRVKPTTSGAGTLYYVMETLNTPLGAANPV